MDRDTEPVKEDTWDDECLTGESEAGRLLAKLKARAKPSKKDKEPAPDHLPLLKDKMGGRIVSTEGLRHRRAACRRACTSN